MKLQNDFFRITSQTETDGKPVFDIRINAEHEIFRAHFPDNPIVPGVCQVQMLAECMETFTGNTLYLRSVKNIKYVALLTPRETIELQIVVQRLIKSDDSISVTASLQTADVQFSKISLTLQYQMA